MLGLVVLLTLIACGLVLAVLVQAAAIGVLVFYLRKLYARHDGLRAVVVETGVGLRRVEHLAVNNARHTARVELMAHSFVASMHPNVFPEA